MYDIHIQFMCVETKKGSSATDLLNIELTLSKKKECLC